MQWEEEGHVSNMKHFRTVVPDVMYSMLHAAYISEEWLDLCSQLGHPLNSVLSLRLAPRGYLEHFLVM